MGTQVKVDINDPAIDTAFTEYEKFVARVIDNPMIRRDVLASDIIKHREALIHAVVTSLLKSLTEMETAGEE